MFLRNITTKSHFKSSFCSSCCLVSKLKEFSSWSWWCVKLPLTRYDIDMKHTVVWYLVGRQARHNSQSMTVKWARYDVWCMVGYWPISIHNTQFRIRVRSGPMPPLTLTHGKVFLLWLFVKEPDRDARARSFWIHTQVLISDTCWWYSALVAFFQFGPNSKEKSVKMVSNFSLYFFIKTFSLIWN